MARIQGSCLCGQVKYEVLKIESGMGLGHCHCSMCRKFHGAAFATFGVAKLENFRWTAGESALQVYKASNGTSRKFCGGCGSSLIFVANNDDGTTIEFTLGTLDTEIDERPDVHIFVDSKANWFEITDDLPQFCFGRNG